MSFPGHSESALPSLWPDSGINFLPSLSSLAFQTFGLFTLGHFTWEEVDCDGNSDFPGCPLALGVGWSGVLGTRECGVAAADKWPWDLKGLSSVLLRCKIPLKQWWHPHRP